MQYNFRNDCFWNAIPAWEYIGREEFSDYKWQLKNSIHSLDRIVSLLSSIVDPIFLADIRSGLEKSAMNIRITPYLFSQIDWSDPYHDPLRKQYLPLESEMKSPHPWSDDDSLAEKKNGKGSLIVHRYPDKVLFLPITVCPVYCMYCTRSRLVGGSTKTKEKDMYAPKPKNWTEAFHYLRENEDIEDVVISGGDLYQISAKHIELIGKSLLDIPNIRRVRFATKGLAVLPMKVLGDHDWTNAISNVVEYGREKDKQVFLHTHFNHPKEITEWTREALSLLFKKGIIVRNQSVLLAGVNDNPETMKTLIKYLSYMGVQPYYIYLHDMVPYSEHLRTSLKTAVHIEKSIRGSTAGFNTPTIVCDLLMGGGKRQICSYEYYDELSGISLWKSPNLDPDKIFFHCDPLDELSKEGREIWCDKKKLDAHKDLLIQKINQ